MRSPLVFMWGHRLLSALNLVAKTGNRYMIRKLIRMTIASAFLCGMFSTAFAAGGGEVVTSDPSKHFDEKGKLPSCANTRDTHFSTRKWYGITHQLFLDFNIESKFWPKYSLECVSRGYPLMAPTFGVPLCPLGCRSSRHAAPQAIAHLRLSGVWRSCLVSTTSPVPTGHKGSVLTIGTVRRLYALRVPANTPWNRVKLALGFGTSAAS